MKLKNYMRIFVLGMFFIILFLNIYYINAIIIGNEDDTHPYVFKCGETSYLDDATEPGRISEDGQELIERKYQSLFEGEQIVWNVLVMDFNGIENLNENQPVYVTVGDEIKIGNVPEVICMKKNRQIDFNSCNLNGFTNQINEFDSDIMSYYYCILTIETPESMYGQKWITIEAHDKAGNIGMMEEAEGWFTNPVIGINVNDSIIFDRLRPGKTGYSNEISIKSSSDEGSGVIMDMFISGTDFSSSNETYYCPNKQTLGLDRIKYYAKNGIIDTSNLADSDIEGYRSINYGIGFNNPVPFYNYAEIIPKNNDPKLPMYFLANQMGTNDEIILKFKVDVPQQCKGNFNNGEIYIWGEAI